MLRVCAQQAQQLQAFKLARWAYTQLQALRLPSSWQVCKESTGTNGFSHCSMVQSSVNHVTCDDASMTGFAHTNYSYHQAHACMLHIVTVQSCQAVPCRTLWTCSACNCMAVLSLTLRMSCLLATDVALATPLSMHRYDGLQACLQCHPLGHMSDSACRISLCLCVCACV